MTSPDGTETGSAPWYTPPGAAAPGTSAPLPQSWPVPEQAPPPQSSVALPVPAPLRDYGPPPQGVWQQGPVVGPTWGPPASVRLATPGARLGALLLDVVLLFVTFGIGWLVWSLVVWGQGSTPAKGILRQRVVVASTGATASWGRMAVRQALVGGLASWVLGSFTFGLWFVADALTVFSDRHRRLTDRIASTMVVQD